jgi:hypothetical protein
MPAANDTSLNEKDSNVQLPNSRSINNKLDLLDKKMDSLYNDIYISRSDNKTNLSDTMDRIDNALDRLQQDTDEITVSGLSKLIERIDKKSNTDSEKLISDVGDIFTDNGILSTLFNNQDIHKQIASENYTYDLICKYLPKLDDALKIKRDNVLSSDNFDKKFINPEYYRSNKEEHNRFILNDSKLQKKYDLVKFFEKTYMNTSKYGEEFIYIVPYGEAFKRLIRNSQKRRSANYNRDTYYGMFGESTESFGKPETIVESGFIESKDYRDYSKSVSQMIDKDIDIDTSFKGESVHIYFNQTNVIQDIVGDYVIAEEISVKEMKNSMASAYENTLVNEGKLEKLYDNVKSNGDGLTKSSQSFSDGLIVPEELDANKIDNNFLGAVLERIPRENILPIYIGNKCLGYYYFMFATDPTACGFCGGHHSVPGISNGTDMAYRMSEDQEEMAIRYISARIAQSIDTKFINSNKDLKEEIYAILRYNDQFDMTRSSDIGVTFIPAEDMVHCYFDIDEVTHRGISDLAASVVPAMLYILLYLTDIIGKVTRSTDKRVYYVKQNVEQNIARTMMNVVKQIKKGNLGMRQIESMNNILNVVGRFNDFIIPVGASGDPPVQFEVMQGQNIETPTDIMDKMEEAAINATGTPMEFVNSVLQVDYASRFTMANTRFLKTILTRQAETERFFSIIYTKLYNYEYGEMNPLIEIILPPPIYLIINNNSQLFDTVSGMADKLTEVILYNEEDEFKSEFKMQYIKSKLGTYLDFKLLDDIIDKSRISLEAKKKAATEDGESSEEY